MIYSNDLMSKIIIDITYAFIENKFMVEYDYKHMIIHSSSQ